MVAGILLLPSHLHVSSSLPPSPLFTWSPILQSKKQLLPQWPESRAKTLLQIILVAICNIVGPGSTRRTQNSPSYISWFLIHDSDRQNRAPNPYITSYIKYFLTGLPVRSTHGAYSSLYLTPEVFRILHPSLLRSADNTHCKRT